MQRCRESRKTTREGKGGGAYAIAAISTDLGGEDPIRRQQKNSGPLPILNNCGSA
jgi:hypothetical protein